MRLIRYRIVRRWAPGLNTFVIQRSVFWMPWTDVKIYGQTNHATMDQALEYIPNAYRKLPEFKLDLKVWPLKHYINTEQ